MVEFRVGDTVTLCASIRDFCGEYRNAYYIGDINISKYPTPCPITIWTPRCLDFSGILFEFQWTNTREDTPTHNCSDTVKLKTLGSAYTDSQGKAAITYTLTQDDLNLYNSNPVFDLRVCIKNKAKEEVVNFGEIRNEFHPGDDIIILPYIPPPEPTHYISLSLGFVPAELVGYFDQYIVDISEKLMNYLDPLPSPWIYIKTTYDRISNSFNIWVHRPSTLTSLGIVEDIQKLWDWISTWWKLILGIIVLIIALALIALGFVWIPLIILAANSIFLSISLFDAITAEKKAEEKAKNLETEKQQEEKEDKEREAAEKEWEKSLKAKADCIKRLETHRDIHIARIDGPINQYAKYAALVTELKSLKEEFISIANNIIDEFKTKDYTIDVCNSYYIRIDNEINSSNIKISDLINRYIRGPDTYVPPCTGYGNKEDCEKAGCYWYDNKCHDSGKCYLSVAGICLDSIALLAVGITGLVIISRMTTKK